MTIKKIPTIIITILLQVFAAIILVGIIQLSFHWFDMTLPLWSKLLLQSLFAASLSWFFKQAEWWWFINLIAPTAIILANGFALDLGLPLWLYPVIFFVILLLFWNSINEYVPLYLSNKTTTNALIDLLENKTEGMKFIDLGCGLSGSLLCLAKSLPQHIFIGVETAPLAYIISKIRCNLSSANNISINFKNIWDVDLSQYQYVYAFLSPAIMTKLYAKTDAEMKTGSIFISNSFKVVDNPATYIMELVDNRQTKLHIWIK